MSEPKTQRVSVGKRDPDEPLPRALPIHDPSGGELRLVRRLPRHSETAPRNSGGAEVLAKRALDSAAGGARAPLHVTLVFARCLGRGELLVSPSSLTSV